MVITAHLVADVQAFGGTFPVFVHTIAHPDGLVLVDTGMTGTHPLVEDEWHPRGYPERIPRDVVCVINTHLHFDHCGGNPLFPGVPIHVQARELRPVIIRLLDELEAWPALSQSQIGS